MTTSEQIQRVRVYLRERDRWEGQPLYTAILNQLQRHGATGATALRGLAGFGPSYLVRTTSSSDMSDAPVVIEWIDRAERISRLLPLLEELTPNALTTIEDIRVYRAALRGRGPFADEITVGNLALTDVVTIGPNDPIGPAVFTMVGRDQMLLPVVDGRGTLSGVISGGDLQRRAGLAVPLHVLRVLSADERRPFLEPVAATTASSCMTREPRCINTLTGVMQALVGMIEWNHTTLPVLDRDSRLVGLITDQQVVQAAAQTTPAEESSIRNADPPTRVQLIMQISVPQASTTQPLAAVLRSLLATPQRYLVLVDAAGHVRGTITDSDVLQKLTGEERAQFLAALVGRETTLPGEDRGPEEVAQHDPHTLASHTSIEVAIQRFAALNILRAPVVDDDGKLVGLITRNTLLRALAQANS